MEIKGSQRIAADRQTVWDALLDPAVLKACLPGCESVERLSDQEFQVVVAMAIGPLRARFKGRLAVTEQKPPESCVMVFQGEGGAVGFGKGSSSVELKDEGGETALSYMATADVGGKLAQVGSRLIESVARKISDDFFLAFRAQLAGTANQPAANAPLLPSEKVAPSSSGRSLPTSAVSQPVIATVSGSRVMVPGWWLLVSACVGSLATICGMLISR